MDMLSFSLISRCSGVGTGPMVEAHSHDDGMLLSGNHYDILLLQLMVTNLRIMQSDLECYCCHVADASAMTRHHDLSNGQLQSN